ncbi:hypothetical protein PCK1_000974 [Pneumocystis canis]|nr:hypothetical protein PCK1_000974 [Pneumocystis canis]
MYIYEKKANFLQCAVKKCQRSSSGFPLKFQNVQIVKQEHDFNPEFLLNIFYRINWPGLILTLKELFGTVTLPNEKPELTMNHTDMLRELHTLLLEACTQIMEGNLICRNCHHIYPIKEGIPNFLLNEYEIKNAIIIFIISIAARCSLVCGCGQLSFPAIKSRAASITAAPFNIVAYIILLINLYDLISGKTIKISCPGQSTNDT